MAHNVYRSAARGLLALDGPALYENQMAQQQFQYKKLDVHLVSKSTETQILWFCVSPKISSWPRP